MRNKFFWRISSLLIVTLIFLAFSFSKAFGAESQISCRFPGLEDSKFSDDCAKISSDGSITIKESAFKLIAFDHEHLASGSIGQMGCFWINKKARIRKVFCFDNGADYFSDGFARFINEKNQFGFINKELNIVIPAIYDFALPFERAFERAFDTAFEKTYAKVCMGCKIEHTKDSEHSTLSGGSWSLIDKSNKVLKVCPKDKSYLDCSFSSK